LNFFDVFAILIDHQSRTGRAESLKEYKNFDSKFRFVIVASKRAKELLKGAKPRIKGKERNPIRIAQHEVKTGAVEYEIIKSKKEEAQEQEERVLLGEDVASEFEEEQEEPEKGVLSEEDEDEEEEEEEEEIEEETEEEGKEEEEKD
jgi:DNA-directed RNA polymerase subunit K/omega